MGCADRRKLCWAKSVVCAVDVGTDMLQIPLASGSKVGKVFLWRQSESVGGVCWKYLPQLSPMWGCHLKSAPLQNLFLHRSTEPSLLDPTVHHRPCLLVYLYVGSHLVQLYAVTLPPFSTLANEHTELPGCCGISSGEPSPLGPSHFWQRLYDPIFTPFPCCSSQVYPWSTGQCGRAWWHTV